MDKINQLLSLQDDRYNQVEKAYKNYKKSPKDRLTMAYLDTRLESLETMWSNFKQCHDQIVAYVTKEKKVHWSIFPRMCLSHVKRLTLFTRAI